MSLWGRLKGVFVNGKAREPAKAPSTPESKTDSLASFRRSSKMLRFEDMQDEALRDALKAMRARQAKAG